MDQGEEKIHKNKISLLDCQVEVVLKCLEYYCYSANFLLERHGKYTSKEDSQKIALITDTYYQISNQFASSKVDKKIINIFGDDEKNKKIS